MNLAIDSAYRKVIRAMKHRESIETCVAEYTSREPYKIIVQPDGTKTLDITEQPPLDISLIAGEILYQLRSALDHLFFELVKRAYPGGVLPVKLEKVCHFPLINEPPSGFVAPVPKDKLLASEELHRWVPDDAYTFIERLQPYNRGDAAPNLLRLLHKLSNIDKHRHLNAVIGRIDRKHTIIHPKGYTSTVITPFLHHGTELLTPWHPDMPNDATVEVKLEYVPVIAFDESELGSPQTALAEKVIYDLPTLIFWITTEFKRFLRDP